ncbi:MAG: hypothetical protein HY296_05275 [Thaumarchaeota archaeon]|nr:hypothetical protein [Nitrososphaerota archaeon]
MPRPTGVTVLAILDMVGGIIALLGGGLILAGSSYLGTLGYGQFAGLAAAFGGGLLVVGVLAIVVGYGMWSGKGWAYLLSIVLYILGIVTSLGSLAFGNYSSIVGLVIYIIIIWYLWKPHVKAYFGRGAPPPMAPASMPPPSTTP